MKDKGIRADKAWHRDGIFHIVEVLWEGKGSKAKEEKGKGRKARQG